jgi:hypothetical protein
MSTIVDSIVSSIKSDFTKSESEKKAMIDFIEKTQSFSRATDHLQTKFDALLSLITFIETNVPKSSCKIYGSFVRQMFEKMFLSTYDPTGYGDSENHDVDMTIFKTKEEYESSIKEFQNMMDTFEVMEKLDFTAGITFGSYHIVSVQDLTINLTPTDEGTMRSIERIRKSIDDYIIRYNANGTNRNISIDDLQLPSLHMMRERSYMNRLERTVRDKLNQVPHYNIIMKNPETNQYVIIDLLGFPIVSKDYDITKDIDVNTIYMTRKGIQSETDFLTTLQSISKRRGIMQVNMKQMIEDLETKALTFSEKSKIYNQIVNFMGFRTKILSVGYSTIHSHDQIGDFFVETENRCEITGGQPPYIAVRMKCDHPISVMALSGLVNIRSTEYSEFIGCPTCRAKLIPQMKESKPTCVEIPDPSVVSKIFTSGESRRNSISITIPRYTSNAVMSHENVSTVLEHLGLKPVIPKE